MVQENKGQILAWIRTSLRRWSIGLSLSPTNRPYENLVKEQEPFQPQKLLYLLYLIAGT